MNLVSIIVPSYQHGQFLEKRFKSILSQTYPDTELIVLDDASEDGSLAILQRMAIERAFKVLEIAAVNGGSPYRQWLKGLGYAAGKYVWVAESDDEAEPQFLDSLVAAMEAEPEASFAVCDWVRIDASGNRLIRTGHRLPLASRVPSIAGCHRVDTASLAPLMIDNNPLENVSCMLFRADALRSATAGLEAFRYLGDWYTYLRLLRQGHLLYLDQSLARHRLHYETTRVRRLSADDQSVFLAEYMRLTRDTSDFAGLAAEARCAAYERALRHADLRRKVDTSVYSLGEYKRVAIYGASAMGHQIFSQLRQIRLDVEVPFFIDAVAEQKGGLDVEGVPVVSLAAFLPHARSVEGILIASCNFHDEISAALAAAGLSDLVLNRD